jgi:predicted dienelactone hydrolase
MKLRIALAFFSLLATRCSLFRHCDPPPPFDQSGVETRTFDLHDEKRNRDVPIRIYAPRDGGAHPVVFFSHGIGESRDSYVYLGEYWAAHGYVAIHVTHHGSDADFLKKHGIIALHRAVREREPWLHRPLDVSFVLDELEKRSGPLASLSSRVDLSRVAVAGHSAGAYTALVLVGAIVKNEESFVDPRVKAAIEISMPKLEPIFLAGAYDRIRVPVLHLTGTRDSSLLYRTSAKDRRDAFERTRASDQWLVTVTGANHNTFSNADRSDRVCEQGMHRIIQLTTTRFLDAYLRGDAAARKSLQDLEGVRRNAAVIDIH